MAPHGFLQVPDWTSWENQGCGLAVADVGGGPCLAVLNVDAPPGQNTGSYRVGTGLDPASGTVAAWSPWRDVPDWTSWENQGADLAVADITGNGRPDLIVLRVDAPQGQNAGLYRVGFDLGTDGQITGGWSPWIPIPDWFSWENQGAGLAIGDITGNGRPDLVVFMIDDVPNGQNRGVHRIGRDLDATGAAASWSPWVDAPQWFSWANQGGGVALAGSQTPGRKDIVVFGIDNPPGPFPAPSAVPSGQNQAYCQVARAVDGDGLPTADWSSLLGVNNWFSWDNQYGALTVSGAGADQKLLVAAVDNPPGQNAFVYTPLPLFETPQEHGEWKVLSVNSGVLAIHAALLHTGKVLFFAGTGNNQVRDAFPDFGEVSKNLWTSVDWDPNVPDVAGFQHPATIKRDNGRPFDFFCGGNTFLPDGRLFSAGGNLSYNGGNNLGQRETAAFDPVAGEWARRRTMQVGRWYPALVELEDGRILVVSGKNDTDGALNRIFEIYDGATDTFDQLVDPQIAFPGMPFYAHLFLQDNGKVFFSGGRMDDGIAQPAGILDLKRSPVGFAPVASQVAPELRNQSASVLLPPAQSQNVMIIGGGPQDDLTSATGATERIDLHAAAPAFTLAMPLSLPRMHLNAVLLPDRTVFVSGGAIHHEAQLDNDRPQPVAIARPRLQAEIYEPENDSWRAAATATVIRLYHSVALLLPDASVVTAGGNPPPYGHLVPWEEQPNEELKLEVYRPPYLFRGRQPRIEDVVKEWSYGATIGIDSPDTGTVLWAELIRPGSTTHAFDNAQRLVDLPILATTVTGLTVRAPLSPTLAPPGWYMLFLVDTDRVPSAARWVHLE